MSSRVTIPQKYFEELVRVHALYKMGLLVTATADAPISLPKSDVPPQAPVPGPHLSQAGATNEELANTKPYTPPMGVPRGFTPIGEFAKGYGIENPLSVDKVIPDDGQSDSSEG